MTAELLIMAGLILVCIAVIRCIALINNLVDMRYAANCVEDLKFNIMRLFLEQQNILATLGIKLDFRLHNDKFFEKIVTLYRKMYDSYVYVVPSTNTRLKEEYIEQLRSNYEDNISSINTTIILLNSYSCRHNYARDFLPSFLCDAETRYVEDIDPKHDHGIYGTGGGLI